MPHSPTIAARGFVHGYDPASRVRVPMAVVCDAELTHQAVRVWMKVRKLCATDQGCTLPVSTLAAQLSVSPRTVDSALGSLAVRGLQRTEQQVTACGSKAASRWALLPKTAVPGFVDLPIGLVDRLDAPKLRVLAVIVHQTATAGEATADAVRRRLGISSEQAREHCAGLVAFGVLKVESRAGRGGRNLYRPIHLQPPPQAVPRPAPGQGISRAPGAGETCVPDHRGNGENCAPAPGENFAPGAGETFVPYWKTMGEGERTKPCPSRPAEGASPDTGGRTRPGREEREPADNEERPRSRPAGSRPGQSWDRLVEGAVERVRRTEAPGRSDVAAALAGLGPLDSSLTGWRRLRIGVRVTEMIEDERLEPERIAARIRRALDRVYDRGEQVRDVYAFLMKLALLAPYGCQDPACEDGQLWPDLVPCKACLERRRDKASDRRRSAPAEAGGSRVGVGPRSGHSAPRPVGSPTMAHESFMNARGGRRAHEAAPPESTGRSATGIELAGAMA